jgi:hypothetical protein
MICALSEHEFLLYSLEPIFSLHGILSLRDSGGREFTRTQPNGTDEVVEVGVLAADEPAG